MTLIELTERTTLEPWLRRDTGRHLYELGDLGPRFWPATRWYGWRAGAEITQVALRYDGPMTILLAMAEQPATQMHALLAELAPQLPDTIYIHATDGVAEALAPTYALEHHGTHLRMMLHDQAQLAAVGTGETQRLGPADLPAVQAFYDVANPHGWFEDWMLDTGLYYGLRHGGELAAIAGVHLCDDDLGVAAVGNVATHPTWRGRGYASTVCAAVCQELAGRVAHVGLNVRADNQPALRVYQKLGFRATLEYDEYMGSALGRTSGAADGATMAQ